MQLMSRSDDDNGGIPVMSTPRRTGAVPKFASPALQLGQSSTLSDSYESLIGSLCKVIFYCSQCTYIIYM